MLALVTGVLGSALVPALILLQKDLLVAEGHGHVLSYAWP